MDKLPLLREWLLNKYKSSIIFAVLYGSHLYGTATPESDYDVYVVLSDNDITEDIIPCNDLVIGRIDICIIGQKLFRDGIQANEVRQLEAIFVLPQFVIIGNQIPYQQQFICHHPFLRHTFGRVSRNA